MRIKDKFVNGHPDQPENRHAGQRENCDSENFGILKDAMAKR